MCQNKNIKHLACINVCIATSVERSAAPQRVGKRIAQTIAVSVCSAPRALVLHHTLRSTAYIDIAASDEAQQ